VTLAKKLWPESDALGKQIQFATDRAPRVKGDGQTKARPRPTRNSGRGGESPHTREVCSRRPSGALYLPLRRISSNAFFHIRFAPGAGNDPVATTDLIRWRLERRSRAADSHPPHLSDHLVQPSPFVRGAMLFSILELSRLVSPVGLRRQSYWWRAEP
jgi:hypothetical protein